MSNKGEQGGQKKDKFPKTSKSKIEDKKLKELIGFGDVAFPIPYKKFDKPIYSLKEFKREKLNEMIETKYSRIKQFGWANRITDYKYTLAGLFVVMSSIAERTEKASKVFFSKEFFRLYDEFNINVNGLQKNLPQLFDEIADEYSVPKENKNVIDSIIFSNIYNELKIPKKELEAYILSSIMRLRQIEVRRSGGFPSVFRSSLNTNKKFLPDKYVGVAGAFDKQLLENKELYSNVSRGSFVSYIRRHDKSPEIQFRYGGIVTKNEPTDDYMVLQSPFVKVQFSVQKSDMLAMFMYMRRQ